MSRCIYPLTAYKPESGSVSFRRDHRTVEQIQLPCGQCIQCRLERTRQWAVRITHEAQLHEHNHFATFTYNDKSYPGTLVPKHFTDFMKRLRKRSKVRYFMCGEYGDQTKRAHFHAALFGLHLSDLKHYSGKGPTTLWTSAFLESIWGHGFVTVGSLTYDSAAYVASYITKKAIVSAASPDKYHNYYVDQDTGLVHHPEYARMSRNPGIAAGWFEKFSTDVTNHDHVVINGRPQGVPRYYDKLTNPVLLAQHKLNRKEKSLLSEHKNTKSQLQSLQQITLSKLKLKHKTL